MPIFKPSFPAFSALQDALGILDSQGATTDYENGPVLPRLNVQAALESGVVRQAAFMKVVVDIAGGDETLFDARPHVLADWDEIAVGGVIFAGVAGTEVPPTHDAWITDIGVEIVTLAANFTSMALAMRQTTVAAGSAFRPIYFGNTTFTIDTTTLCITRNATFDDPIIGRLPLWVPPPSVSAETIRGRLVTSNALTTTLMFEVLSAPRGVLQRLY